jgi:hypothetical protein
MVTCNQVGPKDAEEHHAGGRPDEFIAHRLPHPLWTACTEAGSHLSDNAWVTIMTEVGRRLDGGWLTSIRRQ